MTQFMNEYKKLDSIQRKLVISAIQQDLCLRKDDKKLDSLYRWCKKNINTIS